MTQLQGLSRIVLFSTALFLMACDQKTAPQQENTTEQTAEQNLLNELKTAPVKTFALTQDDAHDIKVLEDYEQRFQSLSDDLDAEMSRMREEGNYSDEFALTRQQDHAKSALTMLKEIELKTEQGRYIQGLMYSYWEKQDQLLHGQQQGQAQAHDSNEHIKGLGYYLQAQEQLEHWQKQYPKTTTKTN